MDNELTPQPTVHSQDPQRVPGRVPQARWRYGSLLVCLLLVLAVALVFGGTLHFEFVNYDDDLLVYENPIVARGLTAHGLAWAFTTSVANMWYPLTWISYMLDSQIYGMQPWGYHGTNVLLHAATSVILFLALRRMTGSLWSSALVALVFAIHPLRAEAVAWVGERKSPLSGLFFVSTIAAYVAYVRRPLSLARYLAVAGLFTLGLLAKPTLVTLPFLLLLLDYWPLGRWRGAGGAPAQRVGEQGAGSIGSPRESPWLLVLEKVPLFFLSGACCVAAVLSQAGNIAPLNNVPFSARIANASISYCVYLGQLFWPCRLAAFYPQAENHPAWQVGGGLLLLTAVSLAALLACRRQPALLVGWLWFLGTLVPTIGLVQIGKHARADRYTYLPHIGLAIAIVWGLRWGLERAGGHGPSLRWLPAAATSLLLAALMAYGWQQVSYWQNSERLWTHALACTSGNVIAHCNLGIVLAARGQADAAIDQYRKVLEIDPNDIETLNNLGLALAGKGRVDEAIPLYLKALEIQPGYPMAHDNLGIALAGRKQLDAAIVQFRQALQFKPDLASAHYNLGLALAERGQSDEAIAEFRQALEIESGNVAAHYHLARVLARQGHVDEAIAEYRKVLELAPDFVAAHINLGVALAARGQVDEAAAHYRRVLELEPDYADAHNNLGLILANRGKIEEAIAHFRKALETRPDYLEAHYNLAMVLAGQGKPDEARAHYQKALALAADRNDKALVNLIRARISRMN